MLKLIGIAGNARVGKDTTGEVFESSLNAIGIKTQRLSFAAELRKSVDDFLLRETGISAFTKDEKEKKLIRPFLVCWGTEIMRRIDPDVWIKKLSDACDDSAVNIITDLRFSNELEWIQSQDSITLLLKRQGVDPANIYEKENNAILSQKVDSVFDVASIDDPNIQRAFYQNILTLLLPDEKLATWKATCPL